MDRAGTDVAVVSLLPTMLLYWLDGGEAVDFARRVNDEIAAAVAQAPDRLVGSAHLLMQDPDAAAKEAARARHELGLGGCQVGPMIGDTTLDDPAYEALLAQLSADGTPLTLHPYFVGAGHRAGLDRYYLTNLVGHPYQTCVGATRLIMSGSFDRHQRLEVVLVHASSYLRRFTYDTLAHSAPSLGFLIDLVGADRVAYGTDFPMDMGGGSVTEQLAGVDLDDPSRLLISGANAAQLYQP